METLMHVSESALTDLKNNIGENIQRYRGDGFADLATGFDWSIKVDGIKIDLDRLAQLDGKSASAQADCANALIVYEAIGQISPALAREERVWVRLSHVEAFEYTKDRWLTGKSFKNEDAEEKVIGLHFFASGLAGCHEKHALSRLWWSAYVARRAYPENPTKALELMFRRADAFQSIIQKPFIVGRPKLMGAIFKIMAEDSRVLESEASFQDFMNALNRRGGGIVFEAKSGSRIDEIVNSCLEESAEISVPG
jgi:hypothetical protein